MNTEKIGEMEMGLDKEEKEGEREEKKKIGGAEGRKTIC